MQVRRCDFVALAGAAALARPSTARAEDWEPGRVYRLGFLLPTPRTEPVVAAFLDESRIHGLIEGQNMLVVGSIKFRKSPRCWSRPRPT